MKSYIAGAVLALAALFSTLHAEALPDKLTVKIKKTAKPSLANPKVRCPTLLATVSVPFQQLGRAGDGRVEMVLTQQGRHKKITKATHLDRSSRIYSQLKNCLYQAVNESKMQTPEKNKKRTR